MPTTVTDVRRFVGLCTYYRRFEPVFAEIAAFQHLKRPLCWDFMRVTVPSYWTLTLVMLGSAASYHKYKEEKSGASNTTVEHCGKLSETRRYLLAGVTALGHFYHYLYGRMFLVTSDHATVFAMSRGTMTLLKQYAR